MKMSVEVPCAPFLGQPTIVSYGLEKKLGTVIHVSRGSGGDPGNTRVIILTIDCASLFHVPASDLKATAYSMHPAASAPRDVLQNQQVQVAGHAGSLPGVSLLGSIVEVPRAAMPGPTALRMPEEGFKWVVVALTKYQAGDSPTVGEPQAVMVAAPGGIPCSLRMPVSAARALKLTSFQARLQELWPAWPAQAIQALRWGEGSALSVMAASAPQPVAQLQLTPELGGAAQSRNACARLAAARGPSVPPAAAAAAARPALAAAAPAALHTRRGPSAVTSPAPSAPLAVATTPSPQSEDIVFLPHPRLSTVPLFAAVAHRGTSWASRACRVVPTPAASLCWPPDARRVLVNNSSDAQVYQTPSRLWTFAVWSARHASWLVPERLLPSALQAAALHDDVRLRLQLSSAGSALLGALNELWAVVGPALTELAARPSASSAPTPAWPSLQPSAAPAPPIDISVQSPRPGPEICGPPLQLAEEDVLGLLHRCAADAAASARLRACLEQLTILCDATLCCHPAHATAWAQFWLQVVYGCHARPGEYAALATREHAGSVHTTWRFGQQPESSNPGERSPVRDLRCALPRHMPVVSGMLSSPSLSGAADSSGAEPDSSGVTPDSSDVEPDSSDVELACSPALSGTTTSSHHLILPPLTAAAAAGSPASDTPLSGNARLATPPTPAILSVLRSPATSATASPHARRANGAVAASVPSRTHVPPRSATPVAAPVPAPVQPARMESHVVARGPVPARAAVPAAVPARAAPAPVPSRKQPGGIASAPTPARAAASVPMPVRAAAPAPTVPRMPVVRAARAAPLAPSGIASAVFAPSPGIAASRAMPLGTYASFGRPATHGWHSSRSMAQAHRSASSARASQPPASIHGMADIQRQIAQQQSREAREAEARRHEEALRMHAALLEQQRAHVARAALLSRHAPGQIPQMFQPHTGDTPLSDEDDW